MTKSKKSAITFGTIVNGLSIGLMAVGIIIILMPEPTQTSNVPASPPTRIAAQATTASTVSYPTATMLIPTRVIFPTPSPTINTNATTVAFMFSKCWVPPSPNEPMKMFYDTDAASVAANLPLADETLDVLKKSGFKYSCDIPYQAARDSSPRFLIKEYVFNNIEGAQVFFRESPESHVYPVDAYIDNPQVGDESSAFRIYGSSTYCVFLRKKNAVVTMFLDENIYKSGEPWKEIVRLAHQIEATEWP